MAEAQTKAPAATTSETRPAAPEGQAGWHPLAPLRQEMDRLFDDFFARLAAGAIPQAAAGDRPVAPVPGHVRGHFPGHGCGRW